MISIQQANELIRSRQSFYPMQMQEGAKIPNEAIWQLLENANYAPSHKRTEPWRYVVFSEEQVTNFYKKLIDIYKSNTPEAEWNPAKISKLEMRAQAVSHVIAICMQRDEAESVPVQEEEYAVACSVQNILLSMKPLNIIGYWGTGSVAFSAKMHEFLELGENDKCMGFLQCGVPKADLPEIPKQQMSPIQDKVRWL